MNATDKPVSKAQQKRDKKASAIVCLREMLPPGSTVYTILRHVSRSGMMRHIGVVIGDEESGGVENITWLVARALDMKIADDGGLKASGCGMDMGFRIVYDLSYTLYPKGFECIGEKCRSNDHVNGDRNREPHHHKCGGYALRHNWL